MKEIPLTKGLTAKVSDADYEKLAQYKWYAQGNENSGYYAAGWIDNKSVPMHRYIMGVTETEVLVDHKNGDRLDNQRRNLRKCTKAENARNRKVGRNNTTGYKGVQIVRKKNSLNIYRATIKHGGKLYALGDYPTKEQAAQAYKDAATRLHGDLYRK